MKTPRAFVLLLVSTTICLYPLSSHGHGETLIQIGNLTQQIEGATTNKGTLYLHRGQLFREHKDWDRAEADFERAIEFGANRSDVNLNRARLCIDKGELEQARELFNSSIAESQNGEAYFERGQLWLKFESSTNAINDMAKALSLLKHPEPNHYTELAAVLVQNGERKRALDVLDSGIRKFGPLPSLQSDAVDIEISLNNLDSAVTRVDSTMKIVDRKEHWHARKGGILLRANRLPEAQKAFTASLRAIDLLPPVLKQSPAMLQLQAELRRQLNEVEKRRSTSNNETSN